MQGLQLQYLRGPNDEVILIGLGESTQRALLWAKNYIFWGIFWYILGEFFLSFHLKF